MRKSLSVILVLMPIFTLLACGNSNLNNRPQAAPNPPRLDPPLTGTLPSASPGNNNTPVETPSNPTVVTAPTGSTPINLLSFSKFQGKWRIESHGKKTGPLQKWDALYQGIEGILDIKETGAANYTGSLKRVGSRAITCKLNFSYQFSLVSESEFKSTQGVSAEPLTASACSEVYKDLTNLFKDAPISYALTGTILRFEQKNRLDNKAVIVLQKIL